MRLTVRSHRDPAIRPESRGRSSAAPNLSVPMTRQSRSRLLTAAPVARLSKGAHPGQSVRQRPPLKDPEVRQSEIGEVVPKSDSPGGNMNLVKDADNFRKCSEVGSLDWQERDRPSD